MTKQRYIIVEDDKISAVYLKTILDEFSHLEHVGTYGGTTEAVVNIQKQKPDILFLDITISGLDGPELVDLINPTPKIVVVSSHPKEKMKDYDIDYVDFIHKPVSEELVASAVEKCK